MKKIIFLLALLITAPVIVWSQYYYIPYLNAGSNPGGLNTDNEYPVGGGLPATWTSILSGNNTSPTWSAVQTIPFSFNFNGTPVSQYKVSSSGVLTFTTSASSAPGYTNTSIPSPSIPDNSIVVWGIKGTGSNDEIVTKVFGTAPNRQLWIMFSSYTNGSNWTYWSIVLEETTDNIYIVDQRHANPITGLTIGIQINTTTAYGINNGQNTVSSVAGSDATPADNSYYKFIYGTQPAYDMSCTSNSVSNYLINSQAPFNITGTISNYGSQAISSFTLNYSVNNSPAVSGNITGVNIPSYGSYNYTHPTPWNPISTGTYNFKVWATNLNGNNDQDNSNDTLYFSVNVVDTMVTRTCLLEVFTSSTCSPCAPANANMESVLPGLSYYTVIKYQQDFPGAGDPYSTTEGVNRRGYYGINSIPRMEIDGQWDQHAGAFTQAIFNSYQTIPSFMSIDITSATYSGTNVTVNAIINPVINYGGGTYRYHVVIVEKETTGNIGTNGETQFFNVMMDMIPNETGNTITSLVANNPINVTKTTNMTSTHVEEMNDLRAVVFVQNNTDKKVLQSAWKDISLAASVFEKTNFTGFQTFPNPADNLLYVTYNLHEDDDVSLTLTDLTGKIIHTLGFRQGAGRHTHTINVSDLPAGLYMITIYTSRNQYAKKITIE